jgi:hypothetical protein
VHCGAAVYKVLGEEIPAECVCCTSKLRLLGALHGKEKRAERVLRGDSEKETRSSRIEKRKTISWGGAMLLDIKRDGCSLAALPCLELAAETQIHQRAVKGRISTKWPGRIWLIEA